MLNFDEIEDCFPEHGALCATDGRVTVSAQWLHDFAKNIAAREREACANAVAEYGDDLTSRWILFDAADRIRKRSNVELTGSPASGESV